MKSIRFASIGFCTLLLAVGLLSGCASSGMSSKAGEQTVAVTNRQGQVGYYTFSNGGVVMHGESGMTQCPQCDTDVKMFQTSGMIDPVCKACGAKRSVVNTMGNSQHGHQ